MPAVKASVSALLAKSTLAAAVLVFREFSVRPPAGTVTVPANLIF